MKNNPEYKPKYKGMKIEDALCEGILNGFYSQMEEEYKSARKKFKDFNSPHEGYAVIKEEFDELWELVMNDQGRSTKTRKECVQIATMAMAYYVEVS